MKIECRVNGVEKTLSVPPMKRMLDVLREDLGLLGSKEGCSEGECGACAAVMDGRLVDTCLVPAVQMAGASIRTVEGLGSEAALDDLQQVFLEEGAVHCGFCTPGMLMAAYALLLRDPHPTEERIRVGLSGNICRCTGYEKICRAVERAAALGYGERIAAEPRGGQGLSPIFEGDEVERFFSPRTLDEALAVLAAHPDILLFSGGTDVGPDVKNGKLKPVAVMDIFSVAELKGVALEGDGPESRMRIGACATNTDIVENETLWRYFPALATASSRSGALAMQNRATIGGNLCTASGAGDLPVALLALNARVRTASASGGREMPLDDFIVGYRKNALHKGELLREIVVPLPRDGAKQAFYKRGSRKALTLSRASLALYLCVESGRIVEFRAAAGSMSPVPIRLERLSAEMPGREMTATLADEAARIAYDDVNPRKSPQYRKTMIANLTRRFFSEAFASL